MQKWWSLFFATILLACFALALASPALGWWLPPGVSSYSAAVDRLFYEILILTTVFFVLTEVILVVAMFRYAGRPAAARASGIHGNNLLELLWTLIPGVLLVYIAYAQINVWNEMKLRSRMDARGADQVMQVTGRQWEWRVRYPTPEKIQSADSDTRLVEGDPRAWAEAAQVDDLRGVNELHTWKNANVKVFLKAEDVIHSFFLPHLRLKQDALPGKTIELWFRVLESNCHRDPKSGEWMIDTLKGQDILSADAPRTNQYELACAELCGGRHYAMRGQLYVHSDKSDYLAWYKQSLEKQSYPLKPRPGVPSAPVAANP